MKYIILTALIATALLINWKITNENKMIREWGIALSQVDTTYKGKFTGYKEPTGHLKTLKCMRLINYVFAQEEYYKEKS